MMEAKKRLIDANSLLEKYWQRVYDGEIVTVQDVRYAIENAPTVDAVEVVHGRWVNAAGCRTICDHCGEYPLYDYWGRQKLSNYCPNCGKKMGSEPALSEGAPAGYCNRAVGDPSD
jgi:hypothetical protein